jgi:hypothetical protein
LLEPARSTASDTVTENEIPSGNGPPAVQVQRILGLDVARAVAIAGMVVIHFNLIMAYQIDETSEELSDRFAFLDINYWVYYLLK